MDDRGLYDHQYERYYESRDQSQGYDFQRATSGSVPVPKVTFKEKLRWWTWDRWRRRKQIRKERERRVQDIVDIGAQGPKA